MRGVADELADSVQASRASVETGNWQKAESELRRAIDRWLEPGSYTAISLRHSEIDAITDDFFDLLKQIYSRDEGIDGGYEHVLTALRRLAEMETPSLGSVF